MTRLYKGQKKHYFFYAGRKDTIKACIYVKELVRFFKYRMIDHSFPGVGLYNCTFEPAYTIEEICTAMQSATGMKSYVPLIPGKLLLFGAGAHRRQKGWHPPGPREKADGLHQYLRQKAGRNGLPLPLYLGGKLPRLV